MIHTGLYLIILQLASITLAAGAVLWDHSQAVPAATSITVGHQICPQPRLSPPASL